MLYVKNTLKSIIPDKPVTYDAAQVNKDLIRTVEYDMEHLPQISGLLREMITAYPHYNVSEHVWRDLEVDGQTFLCLYERYRKEQPLHCSIKTANWYHQVTMYLNTKEGESIYITTSDYQVAQCYLAGKLLQYQDVYDVSYQNAKGEQVERKVL